MFKSWEERRKFALEVEFMKAYQSDTNPIYNAQVDYLFKELSLEQKMAVTCYFCMYPFDKYNPGSMTFRKAARLLKWPLVKVHRNVTRALKRMRKH